MNTNNNQGGERPATNSQLEIEELRSKLRLYEAQEEDGRAISNQAPPKNVSPAQRDTGRNPDNEIADMRNYLAEVMAAIRGFENRLSTQQEQQPTPSDRSWTYLERDSPKRNTKY